MLAKITPTVAVEKSERLGSWGSMVARQKLKGIVVGTPQVVEHAAFF